MRATLIATLDGVWELTPALVFRSSRDDRPSFLVDLSDVDRIVEMAATEPDLETSGFTMFMGTKPDDEIEVPPGEPARNVLAALRWYQDAIDSAGPMPASNE